MKKYVLVGGSYGIGKALVDIISKQGNHSFVFARTQGDIIEDTNTTYISHDILSAPIKLDMIEGGIDGLVYLPGSINLKPFHRTSIAEFTSDLNINFLKAVETIQICLPKLKENKGSIVLVSTVATTLGMPFHSSISASKGALESFALSLAAELAPHIRVNTVSPSLTDTPLSAKLLSSSEKRTVAAKRHPMETIGTPNDIAEAIYFLLSEKSSWITGQKLRIDGGISTIRLV